MIKTLGHLLLSAVFISGGSAAFLEPGERSQKVAAAGIPYAHEATMLNGAVMMIAGTMLALDIAPKLSALALIGTLIPTTFVGHPFWKETDSKIRAHHQIHFLKNLATLGGLIAVLSEKD